MAADPYKVLGLEHGASEAEVRAAHRRLAKKHHPDMNPGDKTSAWIFRQVQRAYETLRHANDVRSEGQERPPRAQEDNARAHHASQGEGGTEPRSRPGNPVLRFVCDQWSQASLRRKVLYVYVVWVLLNMVTLGPEFALGFYVLFPLIFGLIFVLPLRLWFKAEKRGRAVVRCASCNTSMTYRRWRGNNHVCPGCGSDLEPDFTGEHASF